MSVYPEGATVRRHAILSEDGLYRYRLTRAWAKAATMLPFIMLNPSTADALDDDPTIRKCVGFARRLGYEGIGVWNLYAFRATKPPVLWAAHRGGVNIVGVDNDRRLRNLFEWAGYAQVPVIAAWGAHAREDRVREVLALPGATKTLRSLALTDKGIPRHPLMLGYEGVALAPLVPHG